jgi:hypothetical protein
MIKKGKQIEFLYQELADFHEFTIRDNGQVFQKISEKVLAFFKHQA